MTSRVIDMSGWASVGDCASLAEAVREAREDGRRNREHYQREIRRMRALTPEERSARVR